MQLPPLSASRTACHPGRSPMASSHSPSPHTTLCFLLQAATAFENVKRHKYFSHQVYRLFLFLDFMFCCFLNSRVLSHGGPSSPCCGDSLLYGERGLLFPAGAGLLVTAASCRGACAQQLPHRGVWHPPRRDQTPVPCTGRQILTRCYHQGQPLVLGF